MILFNSINPLVIPEEYFTSILNKFMNIYIYNYIYMFTSNPFSKGFIDYANANELKFCLLLLMFSICPHAFTSCGGLATVHTQMGLYINSF